MKDVHNEKVLLGLLLISTMTDEEFEAWLNGENLQPAEAEKYKQALAEFEAVPIKDKIADLKRRLAAKQKG